MVQGLTVPRLGRRARAGRQAAAGEARLAAGGPARSPVPEPATAAARLARVVVVPCFDEEHRLVPRRLEPLTSEPDLGLLLVDDGSTDGTRAVLEGAAAVLPRTGVLPLDRNVGKGEAVRRGLLAAIDRGADVVGYLDADLATPPTEMRRLLDVLEAEPQIEVVMGARVALLGHRITRSPVRHYLGRVFATAASISLGLAVYDTQCGAKAFRVTPALRTALRTPFRSRWAFDVELLHRILTADGRAVASADDRVVELPLREWTDTGGSKVRPLGMVGAFAAVSALTAERVLRDISARARRRPPRARSSA